MPQVAGMNSEQQASLQNARLKAYNAPLQSTPGLRHQEVSMLTLAFKPSYSESLRTILVEEPF
ncbi:MAG: hypothetical protein ACJA04_000224 [Cellvibrionaceae bacterium]|jgi:hypothetical protein